MSSGMKSGKIFVFDEKYISRNVKVQEERLIYVDTKATD